MWSWFGVLLSLKKVSCLLESLKMFIDIWIGLPCEKDAQECREALAILYRDFLKIDLDPPQNLWVCKET